jgi:hypothetical protein
MSKSKPVFTAEDFTATKFQTAQDKADFANQFVKFVESDYSKSEFPKWFYTRLSNTFGHIAHYNHDVFYAEFFGSLEGRCRFARITEIHKVYGDAVWTFSDAELAIQEWAKEYGMVSRADAEFNKATEIRERYLLAQLKAKYEPKNPQGSFDKFYQFRALCNWKDIKGLVHEQEQVIYAVNLEAADNGFRGSEFFVSYIESPTLVDDTSYDDKGQPLEGD